MAQTTVNPYQEIGAMLSLPTSGGLDSIINALPTSNATIDNLVDQVDAFIESIFYTSATEQVTIQIKSVARTCINSFVNNLVMGGQAGYNAKQFRFIELLIGNSLTSNLPLISIQDRIEDVDDNLSDNQLAVDEQTPLLLASTIGFHANIYWNAVITNIATTPWAPFITDKLQHIGSDVAYWDAAAMNGALAGYGATPSGMIEPSVNFVTNKMVSALTGALTVTAGKVIFKWIPRIQHVNIATLSALIAGGGSKFSDKWYAGSGGRGWNPDLGGAGQSGIGMLGPGGAYNIKDVDASSEKGWADGGGIISPPIQTLGYGYSNSNM